MKKFPKLICAVMMAASAAVAHGELVVDPSSFTQLFSVDPVAEFGAPDWSQDVTPSLAAIGNQVVICYNDGSTPIYVDGQTGRKLGEIVLGDAVPGAVTSDDSGNMLIMNCAATGETAKIYRTRSTTATPELFCEFQVQNSVYNELSNKIKVNGSIDDNAVIVIPFDDSGRCTEYYCIKVEHGQVVFVELKTLPFNGYSIASASNTVDDGVFAINGFELCYVENDDVKSSLLADVNHTASSYLESKTIQGHQYIAMANLSFVQSDVPSQLYFLDVTDKAKFASGASVSDTKSLLYKNVALPAFQNTYSHYTFGDVVISDLRDGVRVYYYDNNSQSFGCYEASMCEPYITEFDTDNLHFDRYGNTSEVSVSAMQGVEYDNLTIPATVNYDGNTYNVVEIRYDGFKNQNMTSVHIPASVRVIGEDAFFGCNRLQSFEVDPDNQQYASDNNALYSKNMQILLLYAGPKCNFVMPNSVTAIYDKAFSGRALESIKLPESLNYIGEEAFFGCSGLQTIDISKNVGMIGNRSLANCLDLVAINVDSENQYYASVDGVLYYKSYFDNELRVLEAFPTARTFVEIPETVTSIRSYAFLNASITEVTLPESINNIGEHAFYGCDKLSMIFNMSKEPNRIYNDIFNPETYANATLYVPYLCSGQYCSVEPWSNFDIIKEMEGDQADIEYGKFRQLFNVDPVKMHDAPAPNQKVSVSIAAIEGKVVICYNDDTTPIYVNGRSSKKEGEIVLGDAVAGAVTNDAAGNMLIVNCAAPGEMVKIYSTRSVYETPTLLYSFYNETEFTLSNKIKVNGDIDLDAYITIPYEGTDYSLTSNYQRIHVLNGEVYSSDTMNIPYTGWGGAPITGAVVSLNGAMVMASQSEGHQALTCYSDAYGMLGQFAEFDDWWCNPNFLDIKGFNGSQYMAVLNTSLFPNWGCAPQLFLLDSSDLNKLLAGTSVKDANTLVFSNDNIKFYQQGEDERVFGSGDVVMAVDGNDLYVYYYDHGSQVFGCYMMTADPEDQVTNFETDDFKVSINYDRKTVTVSALDDRDYYGDLVIPETINHNGHTYEVTAVDVFNERTITSLQLPNTLLKIGSYAFYNCSGLEEVTIPASVEEIGTLAFGDCFDLLNILVESGNKKYRSAYGALSTTDGALLTYPVTRQTIDLPDFIREIDSNAFRNCKLLESIELPESVIRIYSEAFVGCSQVKRVSIPAATELIEAGAFKDCYEIASFEVSPDSYSFTSVDGVLYTKDLSQLCFFPCQKATVEIPETVKEIWSCAFFHSEKLTEVTIPNSVYCIGGDAFKESGLKTLSIGAIIPEIYGGAFDCENLRNIYCRVETPYYIDYGVFNYNIFENATLYVPRGTIDTYRETDCWNCFQHIVEMDFTGIEDVAATDTKVGVVDGQIVISGADDAQVAIYTVSGSLIYSGSASQIPALSHGLHIVVVDGQPFKISI